MAREGDVMEKDTAINAAKKDRRHYLKKDLRRAQIVAAARPIFARKGFHGTAIEEILKASGVAQGTLYLHFDNKREIFRAVMRDALEKLGEIIRPFSDDEFSVSAADPDAVFAYIREKNQRLFSAVREDRDLVRIILREAPGLDTVRDELLSRITDGMVRQVRTELSIFQDLDLIGPVDTGLAARMIVGTMLTLIITDVIADDAPDIERLAIEATRMQFFGMAKRAADESKF
jgi:AcrR family transcriptional regulator